MKIDNFYILANAHRLIAPEYRHYPNWSIACEIFGCGSTSAMKLCRDASIDPDATTVARVDSVACVRAAG